MKMFCIKWARVTLFFVSLNVFSKPFHETSYIIEVKKASKLFDKPSSNGNVVGQAETGTNLIFLEESVQGRWIQIQDSEGVNGWIPKNRTDFDEIRQFLAARNASKNINITKKEKELSQSSEETPSRDIGQSSRISSFYRTLSTETSRSYVGVRFDLRTGYSHLREERKGLQFLSLEASVSPNFHKVSSDFSGALRFNMRAPLGDYFFYAPDYGYSFEKRNSSIHHHLSLGLSGGIKVHRFDLGLRAGYDLFSASHATMEVQLGCSF